MNSYIRICCCFRIINYSSNKIFHFFSIILQSSLNMNYLLIFISFATILFNYPIYGILIDWNQEPIVRTKYGNVQGFNALNETIAVFFGIPYARPPLGEYRFEKPHEPEKWHGILNVTTQRNGCYPHTAAMDKSGNFIGNFTEDCLILNIFTPNNRTKKHSVFVIVHGGGFSSGSAGMLSNYTDIGTKFVQQGIVVVVIQYRLGELGFASTGDQIMPGNLGLWDQTAALKWIQENIAAFGGDPKQITVKGESAGAMAVSALTLSPHSRDLFSRAIQMSGSSMDCRVFGSRVPNETIRMAAILGCPIQNGSKAIKNCLKQKSAEQLMKAVNGMGQARRGPNVLFFTPRFDGEFFPNITMELVKEAPKKETFFGFNKLESLLFTLMYNQNFTVSHQMLPWSEIASYGPEQFRNYISTFVATKERFGANLADEVTEKIFTFYSTRQINSTNGKNNYFYIRQWTEMLGDIGFVVPMIREVREKAKNGWPSYLYHFDYVNETIFAPLVKIHESFHGNDMAHVFRLNIVPEFKIVEPKIEAFMVEAFRNFIKAGNPSKITTNAGDNIGYVWPPVSPQQLNHFHIKLPKPVKMSKMPNILERVEFWANLAKQYPQFDVILERSQ